MHRFDEFPASDRDEAARARARRLHLLRCVRLALSRATRRPSAVRRSRGRALVVDLPVHDDGSLDHDPFGPAARRARSVRMERLRAAAQPARDSALVRLRRRRAGKPERDAASTLHDLFPRETLYRRLLPVPSHIALPAGIAHSEASGVLLADAVDPRVRRQPRGARGPRRRDRRRGAGVRDDLLPRRRRAHAHGRPRRRQRGNADGGDARRDRRDALAGRARSSFSRPTTGWRRSRPSAPPT